ncbi:proline-specific permease [Verticillium alfalfae VaMs.102]|uniref:Proline-specific permease n=1 Tax=Verticillium alfalfae (strain VaMs.102 / ATCC MYA-4576 / FGSC 10136) TaxID=526221 RepID=C9SD91_VERA1|nr:proline-specific permease [Verticillium alfalfae VaMs.102]EEY17056.1 proline-specific permease [Verticillium alfalfae VaMs.102]
MARHSHDGVDHISPDIEHAAPDYHADSDDKEAILPPQLGVGGQGGTQRHLRDYQVTMIGFCSGIGTGLFIGTGSAYAQAGPAVGFSLAISYGYCYTISIAAEASASAILVAYWTDMTPAVIITISLVLILAINLLNVRWYGEVEVFSGSVKVLCFLGLILVSIVITSGGGPTGEAIGFRYWNNPGPFVQYNDIKGTTGQFLGVLSAFVNASFSFIGVETVVICAAESINPHKAIPKSTSRVTYRIGLFYILGALLIGIIVDPRNPDLISDAGNGNASPWVIAIRQAGISILPSIVNACILVSAWSAGLSYCWVGSRMIVAMTTDGQLPSFFGRTWSNGVPYVAVITAWLFGPLAYLSLGSGGAGQAFTWLLNLSTVSGLIAWATLCFCYIRFHRAMKPYTAWFGFIGATIITFVAGFPVFLKGNWSTADFIASYISIPIFIVPIIGWKLWHKTKFQRAATIDLWSGRLHESQQPPPKPIATDFKGKVHNFFS